MTLAQLEEELAARNLETIRITRPPTRRVTISACYYSGDAIAVSGDDVESAVLKLLVVIPRRHPVPVPSKDIIP